MKPNVCLIALLIVTGCNGSQQLSQEKLFWFATCGDPVCRDNGYREKPGIAPCTTQEEGGPCQSAGQQCDPKSDCNQLLVCSDKDPTDQLGACPISRRQFKKSIRYLSEADLAEHYETVKNMRLANYRYQWESDETESHLGFLIDDLPQCPAIAADGNHVDLYGFASMLAAAVQIQADKIEELERKIADLVTNRGQ